MKLKEIYGVKEYPSVFPNDLSCLPPNKDVEFIIDLIVGTMPYFYEYIHDVSIRAVVKEYSNLFLC